MDTLESNIKCPTSNLSGARRLPVQDTRHDNTQPAITSEDVEAADQNQWEPIAATTERAATGIYPGCVPFGYRNTVADGSIEVDPLESRIVTRIFELFASGDHSPMSISDATWVEFGARVSEANVRTILQDCFYVGAFQWDERWYLGAHPIFLRPGLFHQTQAMIGRLARTETISNKIVHNDTSTL
jgi:hypothetical protein